MSFAQHLAEISIKRSKIIQENQIQQAKLLMQTKEKRENQLMIFLTNKYHKSIKDALYQAAFIYGLREKYMNFEYKDFKADFPLLGKPKEVCERWLGEMCNPQSKYLPYKTPEYFISEYETHFQNLPALADAQLSVSEPPTKDHFQGLQYDVWNNALFTVKFTW